MITMFIAVLALTLAAIGCAILSPAPGQTTSDGADERALEAITLSVF
jgi:hypothetical protein